MSRDYADDDVIFDTQWSALKNAMNGNGALDPAPTLTPGGAMVVSIGAANVMRNKVLTAIVPGNVTFTVVAAKSKWGAIWVPATGIPYMKMGAEADRPIMPEPNSWDDVLLGGVLITLGMTVITAPDIIEMMFQTMLQSHMQNVSNPHSVQHSQLGGISANQHHNQIHAHSSHTGIGTDDHHAQIHGHADHNDRTRGITIDILSAIADSPHTIVKDSFQIGGTGAYLRGVQFTKAGYITGTTVIYVIVSVPFDITALTGATIELLWATDQVATVSNINTRIGVTDLKNAGLGGRDQVDDIIATTNMDTTPVAGVYPLSGMTFLSGTSILQIDISRFGGSGSDTYLGDVWIVGARLYYTADM